MKELGYPSRYNDWAMGCTSKESWFDSQQGQQIVLCTLLSRPVVEPHPASHSMSARDFYPGGKVAGVEADHSLPSSVKVKDKWKY
jgi:hypothetical protein